jgi:hypothetical protein
MDIDLTKDKNLLGEEFEKDDPYLEDGDKGEDGILVGEIFR